MELNRPERRALRLAAGLLLAGSAVRLACGPGTGEHAWRPDPGQGERPALAELERAVSEETRKAERADRPLAPGERIDVNRAPPEELERLPRIGPVLAARIVEARERRGGFRRPEELLEVSGIGPRTLARLRPHLRLE